MSGRSKKARSLSAKKGVTTRRRHEAAKFKKRSRASKKGWRRLKQRKRIEEEAKAKPKKRKGPLKEWIVTWAYTPTHKGARPRRADFTVIARSREDAELFVIKAIARGEDSTGADLTWMEKVPWDEVFTMTPKEGNEDGLDKKQIKALKEGFVEIR